MSFGALYGEKNAIRGVTLAEPAAEGHAMAGALTDCEAALRKAEAQFDHVHPDNVAAPCYTVNEFNRPTGSCYLSLSLPERDEPILRMTAAVLIWRSPLGVRCGSGEPNHRRRRPTTVCSR
ncbi:hypothetical protein [Streptomyces sp. NPDC050528]|uniref:hypothetical protein n=1 Tax=unclassified Streptomyces TaxID=2593676 RepID=UPI0037A41086